MILAAGRGTRLGPLGLTVPKILVEIGGEPLLARQLRYLEREGAQRVVLNGHHLANQIADFVNGYQGPLELVLLVEPELLGTAGGVRNALPYLGDEPFVVLYGDVLIDEPLAPLIGFHRTRDAAATLTVYEAASTYQKGVVEVDASGRVRSFAEKQSDGPGLVNAGLYVLDPPLLAEIERPAPLDFGDNVLPSAVKRGERIFAYLLAQPVLDVGTPGALAQARALALRPAVVAATADVAGLEKRA